MLGCIEEIHKVGRIHRDIKSDNFRVHNNRIFIVDFGTILKYKDDKD